MTPFLVYSCAVGSTLKTLLYCLIYILINHLISLSSYKRFIDNALSKTSLWSWEPPSSSLQQYLWAWRQASERVCVRVCAHVHICARVTTHLSPAKSTVTCSAGYNLCGGRGDTVLHAEMASFLSANPCALSSHFLCPLTAPPWAWFIRPSSLRQRRPGARAVPETD